MGNFGYPNIDISETERKKKEIRARKIESGKFLNNMVEDYTLLSKIDEEFSYGKPFTLEDLNDAFGDYTEGGVIFTAKHLQGYVKDGLLEYNKETKEYTRTELDIEEIENRFTEEDSEAA